MRRIVGILLLVGLSGSLHAQTRRSQTVTMPTLIGKTRPQAEALLKAAKLVEYHVTARSGGFPNRVDWQSPRPGASILVGSDVAFGITTGGK